MVEKTNCAKPDTVVLFGKVRVLSFPKLVAVFFFLLGAFRIVSTRTSTEATCPCHVIAVIPTDFFY